jgi:FkbH-like protein
MANVDFRQQIDDLIALGNASDAIRLLNHVWRTQGSASVAGFVASRYEKLRDQLGFVRQRWAFLRSFTVEPIIPIFKAGAYVSGVALETHLGEFNAWQQEALDPDNTLYRFQPDVVVLAVLTRDVAIEGALERFRDAIGAFRKHSSAALIVHLLEQPVIAPAGVFDAQDEQGAGEAIRSINRGLRAIAREYRGVYLLDYDALVARYGRENWGDERKWLTVRLPIASAHLPHMAAEWLRFLHPLSGKSAKCVAVDLDNTLWGGVIGEDGMNGIRLGPEYPGAAFQQVQRALLDLTQRGVLLAVCSKNNPADAMEAISGHPGMLLQPHHFAALRINWNDKAQNLREIAEELNIGLDSIAFLDDNPVERQHVREHAPEAIVIELPEDPMQFARAIHDCPWLERLSLSEEDRRRGALYAAQRQRAELERSVTSKEDFYRSLEQVCEIAPVDESTIARVAQLTQKTNQFNLTTKRYTEQQIGEMTECPGWSVWSLRVKDRYQDNGLVGVAISKLQDGVCEIDTFLMSCRVIGRTVETALLARIAADAKGKGAVELRGLFIPTRKNVPAAGFYRDHGFTEEADGLWKIDLREKRIDLPQWITLKEPA